MTFPRDSRQSQSIASDHGQVPQTANPESFQNFRELMIVGRDQRVGPGAEQQMLDRGRPAAGQRTDILNEFRFNLPIPLNGFQIRIEFPHLLQIHKTSGLTDEGDSRTGAGDEPVDRVADSLGEIERHLRNGGIIDRITGGDEGDL